MRKKERKKDR